MRRYLSIAKGVLIGSLAALSPRALAGDVRAFVVVYDGWGTPDSFVITGRVLEQQGERAPRAGASESENIVDNIKALESDEVRGAELSVTIAGASYTATSDDDGNFQVRVKGLAGAARLAPGEVAVHAAVTGPPRVKAEAGRGHVFVHDPATPFVAVVSDVDDTVVKTYVTDKRKLLGAVLLKNAHQLEPVEGAAAAYDKARAAGARGFFYLSGSPQNFYLRIQEYLRVQGFPRGPLLLKNLGDDSLTKQDGYKLGRLEALLAAHPSMRVVLIGDSGEKDPEIYRALKDKHPPRVAGIVIRKTAGADNRAERFAGMVAIDDKYPSDDVIARLVAPQP